MDITNIHALLDNSATIETMIDILPQDDSGEIVRLTNEDSIQSWEHSEIRYVPDNGFIGMFVERMLEGVLQNITEDFNIENREIVLYLGIRRYVADLSQEDLTLPEGAYSVVANTDPKLGDFVTTFYSLGNFIVDKPDSDEVKDNTKFTAKDYTVKFNVPFNPDYVDDEFTTSFTNMLTSETLPTALWLAEYTCQQVGVTLSTRNFTNSGFAITSNQFQNGEYCRDVLKYIGKLAYSWVRVGWDNKVYIDFELKQTVEQEYNNISKDDYYSLETQKEKYGAINKVVLGSSIVEGDYSYKEDADDIDVNGEKILVINDNPILYTEELRELAVANADVLFGLEYTPLTTETVGHPWLKGTDLISIVDKNDNLLYTYPFDRIITYNGHIRTTLSSYAQTQIEQDYHYEGTGSSVNEKRQTRMILDRQNQTISAVVENTDTMSSQVSSLELSLGNIETIVSNTKVEILEELDNYATKENLTTITNTVTQLQTDTYTKTEINTKLTDGSVTKVQTTSGTFDEDGMHYEKTGAETSSTINEKGVTVEDATGYTNNDLLYAGYVDEAKSNENPRLTDLRGQTVVYTKNSVVDNYFIMGSYSRMEDYEEEVEQDDGTTITKKGTGVFYLGG